VYNKLLNNSITTKQNKYKNKKVQYDEMTFDSKKEYSYYLKYKLMEQAGEIHDLKIQVPFTLIETFKLQDKTYRKIIYKADFTYYDKQDKYHVIDVKSKATRTQVYQLKKKLLAWKYGIEIEEV
jgi:RecB family endonuclease NucS